MWAPFGHHFTENNAFHQDMEKAAKPSNHAALRPFSVHIKHVENDTKIYYFLWYLVSCSFALVYYLLLAERQKRNRKINNICNSGEGMKILILGELLFEQVSV